MAKRAKAHIATLLSEIADLYREGAEGAGGHLGVTVEYEDQKETLSLLSVAGSGPSLVGHVVGRDWLLKIAIYHIGSAIYQILAQLVPLNV